MIGEHNSVVWELSSVVLQETGKNMDGDGSDKDYDMMHPICT